MDYVEQHKQRNWAICRRLSQKRTLQILTCKRKLLSRPLPFLPPQPGLSACFRSKMTIVHRRSVVANLCSQRRQPKRRRIVCAMPTSASPFCRRVCWQQCSGHGSRFRYDGSMQPAATSGDWPTPAFGIRSHTKTNALKWWIFTTVSGPGGRMIVSGNHG